MRYSEEDIEFHFFGRNVKETEKKLGHCIISCMHIKLDMLKVHSPFPADRVLLSWCQDLGVKAKKGGNKQSGL